MLDKRFEYEIKKRPNYEAVSATSWASATALWAYTSQIVIQEPMLITYGMPCLLSLTGYRAYQAYNQRLRNLSFSPDQNVEYMPYEALKKKFRPDALWLGKGFAWTPEQAQQLYDEFLRNPDAMQNKDVSDHNAPTGAYWLHGLGDKEMDIYRNIQDFSSHTLIRGTTGAGKTKQVIIILAQLLMRKNEPTIVIDPKGDNDLREQMRRICEKEGRQFLYFNPSFPEKSCRIDVLRNWARVTQLSDRIKAILPEKDLESFKAIIWNVVNAIGACLVLTGIQPSIATFRDCMDDKAMDQLIIKAIKSWAGMVDKNWEKYYSVYAAREYGQKVSPRIQELFSYIDFYEEVIAPKRKNSDINEVISIRKHDREHLLKLISSLFPVLSMLSSGGLSELLSPIPDPEDDRPLVNTKMIIDNKAVLWLGLDTLSDQTVGAMIGSVLLSDMTSVAGARYNFEDGGDFNVNLIVDEASETVNAPMIQLLNKSRGAGFRNFLLTQTIADFTVRLGSEDVTTQVLGNINNEISLRVKDNKTALDFSDGLPEVMIKRMSTQYQTNIGHNPVTEFGGRYGESMTEEYLPIIPSWVLKILPNFHYFGNFAGGALIKGRLPLLKD